MQQTTLQTKRSKKLTSKAIQIVLLFFVGVWGCASDPNLVYVDLQNIDLASSQDLPLTMSENSPQEIDSSASISSLEERSVFIGSAQDKASEALEHYLTTREQAAAAVLEGIKEAYAAEIDSAHRDGEEEIVEDYRAWLEIAFEELHETFLVHSKKTGPLWIELSWKIGFPDPDPNSIATSTDRETTRRQEEAKKIRDELKELNAAFREVVSTKLGRLEQEREDKLTALGNQMDAEQAAALEKAKKDADAVTAQAFAVLERTALDPEAQLPAVSSAESAVKSEPAQRRVWQKSTPPGESEEDLKAQLSVFLKVHGFQLADSPEQGRNVTQEFVVWRRIYLAGR